jgi:hypothetical protein
VPSLVKIAHFRKIDSLKQRLPETLLLAAGGDALEDEDRCVELAVGKAN